MTQARGVRYDADGAVGHIVLDRPEAANAMDLPAARALGDAVHAANDASIRAVLLTGEGKRFCAGGDAASFVAAPDRATYLRELAGVLEKNVRGLSTLTKPVVVAVQGAVAGAGLAFVLNADIVLAARGTKFVMAYSSIGLTPDCGVSYLLPRVVGRQRASQMALGGKVLDADEALAWGLVSEVVEPDQLGARALELVQSLADGPTEAYAQTKRLLGQSWEVDRLQSAEDEVQTISTMAAGDEATRLIDRFVNR